MVPILAVNLIITLLVTVSFIGFGLFMQFKLSRSENKYLGLILPILAFLLSLSVILGYASFFTISTVDGVREALDHMDYLPFFFLTLITNIPTAILSGIYLSERNKKKVNKAIEKMKIKDL